MSTIQISEELMHQLQEVLIQHDPQNQDAGVSIQYLAAIQGLLLAQLPGLDSARKQELLQQLYQFSERVMQDNLPEAAQDQAFGVWKPGQN